MSPSKPSIDLSMFILAASPKKAPCKVRVVLDHLGPDDRKVFERALSDETAYGGAPVPPGAICKVARQLGYQLNPPAVMSHRNGSCTCGAAS